MLESFRVEDSFHWGVGILPSPARIDVQLVFEFGRRCVTGFLFAIGATVAILLRQQQSDSPSIGQYLEAI